MESLYRVLYDDQCEICQAGVCWLRILDRRRQVECLPIDPALLSQIHPSLNLDECLREIHVIARGGNIYRGWPAVARLARLFPVTWLIGVLGGLIPFRWLGVALYRFVAGNRYALSKCRGGACRVVAVGTVRRRSPLGVFWACYSIGMLGRMLPVAVAAGQKLLGHICAYLRTRRMRLDMLGDKLSLLYIGGLPCDFIRLLFGEQFVMVLYDGIAIDPGSPRMRRALEAHLREIPDGAIRAIVATHHHEEHSGNLNWLSSRSGAGIRVGEATRKLLQPPARLPWVRRVMIGQPPPLEAPFQILNKRLSTLSAELEVIAAPGHCDDHIVLYDRREKLLLAGDAFMGAYFATPNPDVDSRRWLETIERLLSLEIEILVEGHGQIHTLRSDVPDMLDVVIREHPREALERKLRFLRWQREQIAAGTKEGLPLRAIEATCFPWGQRWAWETFWNDQMIRLLSLGHFSRTELVRSFVREPGGADVIPTVYEMRLYAGESVDATTADSRMPDVG